MHSERICYFGLVFCSCAALIGCKVDPSYDFTKLDTEMTILQGATFPVPDSRMITLSDIFDLTGYPYIQCDGNGDYEIVAEMDRVEFTATIPGIEESGRIPVDFEPVVFVFTDVPEFLSGKDQNLMPDLSDMQVDVSLYSGIPGTLTASTAFETMRSGAVLHEYHIENLDVNEDWNYYQLNRDLLPGLEHLLSPLPESLRISDLQLTTNFMDPDRVEIGREYPLSLQATVRTPICFNPESHFTVSIPIDAELDLEQIGLKSAVLQFEYENSIPLSFTLQAYALDEGGRRLDTVQAECLEVFPGNGYSEVYLQTKGDLRFHSLVLELTATSDEYQRGRCFNRNQGIRFKNMQLMLPDGIQVRLDGSSNE